MSLLESTCTSTPALLVSLLLQLRPVTKRINQARGGGDENVNKRGAMAAMGDYTGVGLLLASSPALLDVVPLKCSHKQGLSLDFGCLAPVRRPMGGVARLLLHWRCG